MPFINLHTNVHVTADKQPQLLPALSTIIAQTIGKPEQYVMAAVTVHPMLMAGKPDPAAFADIRSIGNLSPDVNQQLAAKLCRLLHETLAIPADRVFLNFTDVPPGDWGWNGETFG